MEALASPLPPFCLTKFYGSTSLPPPTFCLTKQSPEGSSCLLRGTYNLYLQISNYCALVHNTERLLNLQVGPQCRQQLNKTAAVSSFFLSEVSKANKVVDDLKLALVTLAAAVVEAA